MVNENKKNVEQLKRSIATKCDKKIVAVSYDGFRYRIVEDDFKHYMYFVDTKRNKFIGITESMVFENLLNRIKNDYKTAKAPYFMVLTRTEAIIIDAHEFMFKEVFKHKIADSDAYFENN